MADTLPTSSTPTTPGASPATPTTDTVQAAAVEPVNLPAAVIAGANRPASVPMRFAPGPVLEQFPDFWTQPPAVSDPETITGLQTVLAACRKQIQPLDDVTAKQLFFLLNGIDEQLRTNQANLSTDELQRYQTIVYQGDWMIFDCLTLDQVDSMIRHKFEEFFTYPWEVIDQKLRRLLSFIPDYEARDAAKKRLIATIMQSPAMLSPGNLVINDKTAAGTVQHWLQDWRQFIGERTIDPLLITEYMNTRLAQRRVDEQTRSRIEGLLRLLQMLSLSSLTAAGTEETFVFVDPANGHYKMFDRGEVIDTAVVADAETLSVVRAAYGLDDQGKLLPISQRVLSGLGLEGQPTASSARYQAPEPATITEPATSSNSPSSATATTVTPVMPPIPSAFPADAPIPLAAREVIDQSIAQSIEQSNRPESPTTAPQPAVTEPPTAVQAPAPAPTPSPAPTPPAPPAPTLAPVAQTDAALELPDGVDAGQVARQVLARHQLLFPSADIEQRFLSIVASYLRGNRTSSEATASLTGALQSGGTNLTAPIAAAVLDTCSELVSTATARPAPARTRGAATSPLTPTLEQAQQQMAAMTPAQASGPSQADGSADQAHDANQMQIEDVFAQIDDTPLSTAAQTPQPPAPVRSTLPTTHGRQVLGPIDELRLMTLDDFRRLAPDPADAATKVLQQLSLLEQESLTRKAEGIAAWKASPVNQLYIDLGNTSLSSGETVKQLITTRQQARQATLSNEEFSAIADVNRRLRY